MNKEQTQLKLTALHRTVDARCAALIADLPGKLACRSGCADCCIDDLTVFGVEADLIRHHHAELLVTAEPHAAGACAFLDPKGACRIYEQRPYVCRTQGLPLRWLAEDDAGAVVEMRDICPLNEEPLGTAPADLEENQCWELGVFEGSLASLQAESQGGFELTRESLRGLFDRKTTKL